jgi:hypothetical protein
MASLVLKGAAFDATNITLVKPTAKMAAGSSRGITFRSNDIKADHAAFSAAGVNVGDIVTTELSFAPGMSFTTCKDTGLSGFVGASASCS